MTTQGRWTDMFHIIRSPKQKQQQQQQQEQLQQCRQLMREKQLFEVSEKRS